MRGKKAKKSRKDEAIERQLTQDIAALNKSLSDLSPAELEVCYQVISVEVFRRGIGGEKLKNDVITFKRSLAAMNDQLLVSVTRIIELLRREKREAAQPPKKRRWWHRNKQG